MRRDFPIHGKRLQLEQLDARLDAVLGKASGMWQDREDLPDFDAVRSSWDRRFASTVLHA